MKPSMPSSRTATRAEMLAVVHLALGGNRLSSSDRFLIKQAIDELRAEAQDLAFKEHPEWAEAMAGVEPLPPEPSPADRFIRAALGLVGLVFAVLALRFLVGGAP